MNEQIEREIMFHPEAEVEILSAEDDNEKQIRDIRYFIDNDFDIIIAAPNEAEALTPIISEAYDRGIPVLIFDRSINGDRFTAFQGADNAAIGRQAARYASKMRPEGASVIELQGLRGSSPASERERGFHEVADSLGSSLAILASVPANWNYDDARIVADSLLTLYPDVDIIYAHNDRMALGASDVAAIKGLDPLIIGVDAAPNIGLQAVKDGRIDATFVYPTEGQHLVNTAMAILEGEPYDKEWIIPVSPAVDRNNIDLLLNQVKLINEETEQLQKLKGEVDSYWSQHNSQTALLYACIAILVLVCILLFLVLRNYWQNRRHHQELVSKNRELEEQRDLEKELNSQLAAATQSKLIFFTNVSHDLRTPLTLIAEPVEQVANSANLDDHQKVLMRIADKNVKILHRLINQILDFQKFENDKLEANLEEASPAILGREWAESFMPLARKKHIDYHIRIDVPEEFTMAFDVDKLERVIFNLFSNAFKFTPVKGSVIFKMHLDTSGTEVERLQITVEDTGRGISAENLRNIFARFYQADKVRPEGSGIGLSLAKAFVEMHGGEIAVESKEEVGTTFVVTLPVKHVDNGVSDATLSQSRDTAKAIVSLLEVRESPLPEIPEEDNGKPLVLIIDDNEDIRVMVSELLKGEYRCIGASGGKEGIRMATRYVPDIVICDVMMPGIDGMETCAAIKNELSTSHIPVLLLTACALDEQRAEGYESGADGYLSKPFKSEVLLARISSLLTNRRRIREVMGISNSSAVGEKDIPEKKDVENEFYNKFVSIVKEEMGNMDLNVDTLAERMGMGRSQFYRKIKALTSLSPVELIRDLRLKRARNLLLTTDKSVSEIAYEVGFSTPAYFTKCYREVYSETPTALRDRLRNA